jgi:hypothetical protein
MPAVWTKTTVPLCHVSKRFSLYFDVVAKFWAGGPDEVKAAPLNRICTLARKMSVKKVVVEDVLGRSDVAFEIAQLQAVLDTEGEVTAVSISFLGSRKKSEPSFALIGQVVVITFPSADGPKSYVFEAILRVPGLSSDRKVPLLNNYVLDRVTFDLTVEGVSYHLSGAYFCQPNGVTTTDIDAAIRSTVRSIEGSGAQPKSGSAQPRTGTGTAESVVEGLRRAHYTSRTYFAERSDLAHDRMWTVISSHMESGNPVLLVLTQLGKPDRVLPVIGYTLNTDEWHPGGVTTAPSTSNWFSSSQWVDHLIIQDPLLGPYFCLSRAWLTAALANSDEGAMKPSLLIATVPGDNVTVSPLLAEELAGEYLKAWLPNLVEEGTGKGRWWEYLVKSREFIVLRTTLISRADYRAHLEKLDKMARRKSLAASTHEEKTLIDDFIDSLPNDVWMCEISLPQLYVGNRTKLGEVLIATDVRDVDESFLGSRLPSQIFWRQNGDFFVGATGIDFHAPLLAAADHKNRW